MNFTNSCTMQKSAFILTVFLTLSCLTFNYTFPLHRETEETNAYSNGTQSHNVGDVLDRTKKMAVNVLKRFKNSDPEESKEISKENTATEEKSNVIALQANDKVPMSDFRSFEQLVIMKKYPYLDLKEFDAKYTLSPEHARQNQKLYSGSNVGGDPGICERQAAEADSPTVEVSNRGLSGFAIPKLAENKYRQDLVESSRSVQINLAIPDKTIKTVLESLKSDVAEYLHDKGIPGNLKE